MKISYQSLKPLLCYQYFLYYHPSHNQLFHALQCIDLLAYQTLKKTAF